MNLLEPESPCRILDLGGAGGSFAQKVASRFALPPQGGVKITVADVVDHSAEVSRRGFDFVQLDAHAESLPFDRHEFDIVLCNSVIEHVTLPREECLRTDHDEIVWQSRAWDAQSRFASEIRRVARGYFVQTPHRHFPLELHTWLPGVNWFSHNRTQKLVQLTDRFWIKRCGFADWNLLTPSQMRRLFPDATLHVESLAGLPKSIIAFRPADAGSRDAHGPEGDVESGRAGSVKSRTA